MMSTLPANGTGSTGGLGMSSFAAPHDMTQRQGESPGANLLALRQVGIVEDTQCKFISSFNKHDPHPNQAVLQCTTSLPGNLQTAQGTNHDSAAQSDTQRKHLKEKTAASNTGGEKLLDKCSTDEQIFLSSSVTASFTL